MSAPRHRRHTGNPRSNATELSRACYSAPKKRHPTLLNASPQDHVAHPGSRPGREPVAGPFGYLLRPWRPTTLTYWIWWAWLMALLASLLEIEGRLMFGVHWFSDVSVVIQRWFVKGLTAGAA